MPKVFKPKEIQVTFKNPVGFDPQEIAAMSGLRAMELLGASRIHCLCETTPLPVETRLDGYRYRCQHGEIHDLSGLREIHIVLRVTPQDPLVDNLDENYGFRPPALQSDSSRE